VAISDHTLWQVGIVAQIASYCVGAVAAVVALRTYTANSARERSKWAFQLYEKFYEGADYKRIRDLLDSEANTKDVINVVAEEGSEFTDYLNFFEMVTALTETKQLSKADVLRLFQYYFQCLKRHDSVMRYLDDPLNGYETLTKFFSKS
jgi:hypothetical protein